MIPRAPEEGLQQPAAVTGVKTAVDITRLVTQAAGSEVTMNWRCSPAARDL